MFQFCTFYQYLVRNRVAVDIRVNIIIYRNSKKKQVKPFDKNSIQNSKITFSLSTSLFLKLRFSVSLLITLHILTLRKPLINESDVQWQT